jgi:hypothetical protein
MAKAVTYKRGDVVVQSIHGESVIGVVLNDSIPGYGLDVEALRGASPTNWGLANSAWSKALRHATAAEIAALPKQQRSWLKQKTQQLEAAADA